MVGRDFVVLVSLLRRCCTTTSSRGVRKDYNVSPSRMDAGDEEDDEEDDDNDEGEEKR